MSYRLPWEIYNILNSITQGISGSYKVFSIIEKNNFSENAPCIPYSLIWTNHKTSLEPFLSLSLLIYPLPRVFHPGQPRKVWDGIIQIYPEVRGRHILNVTRWQRCAESGDSFPFENEFTPVTSSSLNSMISLTFILDFTWEKEPWLLPFEYVLFPSKVIHDFSLNMLRVLQDQRHLK